MAKKVIDGYLAKQIFKSDGKREETLLGVAFSEYDARDIIEDNCKYYSECPFEYSVSKIDNGIAFTKNRGNEVIMYTIEQVCVISDG